MSRQAYARAMVHVEYVYVCGMRHAHRVEFERVREERGCRALS